MEVNLACPDCGFFYETEDGDGKCPRCAEMDEIETQVEKLLNDLRPRHLEDDDVRSAAEEGAWKHLWRKSDGSSPKREGGNLSQTTKRPETQLSSESKKP